METRRTGGIHWFSVLPRMNGRPVSLSLSLLSTFQLDACLVVVRHSSACRCWRVCVLHSHDSIELMLLSAYCPVRLPGTDCIHGDHTLAFSGFFFFLENQQHPSLLRSPYSALRTSADNDKQQQGQLPIDRHICLRICMYMYA